MHAVVARPGALSLEDYPEPVPGEGQVLVKSLATGICGSDLHALHNMPRRAELAERAGFPVIMRPDRPTVFGHEFCAEVIGYGEGTTQALPIGTRVIALPFAKGDLGFELVGFSNRFPGGFGERMVLTESLLLPVPDGVSSAHAALTEPLAVGVHAVRAAEVPSGSPCMVIGCGPIGLAIVAALKAAGLGPIVAVDYSATRRAMATRYGADEVVDPAVEAPGERWERLGVPQRRPDPTVPTELQPHRNKAVIFECVGVPGMLQTLLDTAPPFTRIVMVGVCQEQDTIDQWIAIQKQLELRYVFGCTRDEFEETFTMIADGTLDPGLMLTSTVGLGGVADAFAALRQPDREVKVVIEPTRI